MWHKSGGSYPSNDESQRNIAPSEFPVPLSGGLSPFSPEDMLVLTMSPRFDFQVNTHLKHDLLISNKFQSIASRSPTQMSSESSSLLNALGIEPPNEERLQPIEEPLQFQTILSNVIPTDVQRNGKNTTSPCD